MSHTTSIRRALTVAGAAGILAFSVAGPASARPDPGNGSQQEWSCHTNCYEGGTVSGPATTVALDDIDLTINAGELFFLLGPSGCGKSTLLRLIAGLHDPVGQLVVRAGAVRAGADDREVDAGVPLGDDGRGDGLAAVGTAVTAQFVHEALVDL